MAHKLSNYQDDDQNLAEMTSKLPATARWACRGQILPSEQGTEQSTLV